MEKRATMHEVAELAGVSQATVSLVLNGVPNARVSKATRRRVQDAADQLGYRRGKAHTVPPGRQRVIGLFIDEVSTTPFAAPFIEGARNEAALQDVTVARPVRASRVKARPVVAGRRGGGCCDAPDAAVPDVDIDGIGLAGATDGAQDEGGHRGTH